MHMFLHLYLNKIMWEQDCDNLFFDKYLNLFHSSQINETHKDCTFTIEMVHILNSVFHIFPKYAFTKKNIFYCHHQIRHLYLEVHQERRSFQFPVTYFENMLFMNQHRLLLLLLTKILYHFSWSSNKQIKEW